MNAKKRYAKALKSLRAIVGSASDVDVAAELDAIHRYVCELRRPRVEIQTVKVDDGAVIDELKGLLTEQVARYKELEQKHRFEKRQREFEVRQLQSPGPESGLPSMSSCGAEPRESCHHAEIDKLKRQLAEQVETCRKLKQKHKLEMSRREANGEVYPPAPRKSDRLACKDYMKTLVLDGFNRIHGTGTIDDMWAPAEGVAVGLINIVVMQLDFLGCRLLSLPPEIRDPICLRMLKAIHKCIQSELGLGRNDLIKAGKRFPQLTELAFGVTEATS